MAPAGGCEGWFWPLLPFSICCCKDESRAERLGSEEPCPEDACWAFVCALAGPPSPRELLHLLRVV